MYTCIIFFQHCKCLAACLLSGYNVQHVRVPVFLTIFSSCWAPGRTRHSQICWLIDLTYVRHSLTNIPIRVFITRRSLFNRENASYPLFFRGGVHIPLLCPASTCVCVCAVNAGGCVIDLLVQGWASTSSLFVPGHRKQCKHR